MARFFATLIITITASLSAAFAADLPAERYVYKGALGLEIYSDFPLKERQAKEVLGLLARGQQEVWDADNYPMHRRAHMALSEVFFKIAESEFSKARAIYGAEILFKIADDTNLESYQSEARGVAADFREAAKIREAALELIGDFYEVLLGYSSCGAETRCFRFLALHDNELGPRYTWLLLELRAAREPFVNMFEPVLGRK